MWTSSYGHTQVGTSRQLSGQELAAVSAGSVCVVATLVVAMVICWRKPMTRAKAFWDGTVVPIFQTVHEYFANIRGFRNEENSRLISTSLNAPYKTANEETEFVVPQIFIHRQSLCYGSQGIPYDLRRTSVESLRKSPVPNRRNSYISLDGRLYWIDGRPIGPSQQQCESRKSSDGSLYLITDSRRESSGSNCSRKSSESALYIDFDRRGSSSSRKSSDGILVPLSDGSRRDSASSRKSSEGCLMPRFLDYDRRSSASSRSSRKSSDAGNSNMSFEDDDYSSEALDSDEFFRMYARRVSFRLDSPMEPYGTDAISAALAAENIRRSNSLAEIRQLNILAKMEAARPYPKLGRRATMASIKLSGTASPPRIPAAADVSSPSQILKKKVKMARRGSIGLPFKTPVLMQDLNLEDMVTPPTMSPVQPVGTIEIHVQFNDIKTSVSVTVIKANDLNILGSPSEELFNPYVKVFLIPGRSNKYRTKTVTKTRNPLFEETFKISELGENMLDCALEFQVYSYESVTKRQLLGVCSVRLSEVDKLEDGYAEITLFPQSYKKCHQGDLRVSGCYQPVAGKMVFNILEARCLPRVSLMGTINPYVKIEMYLNGIREGKQKTKTKQGTIDPQWNHQCVFEVNRENPKLLGHTFLFTVAHKDRMKGTQIIGQVELGWYSHGEQLDHWCEIMEHPHRPTDYWHPVIKTSKFSGQ